MAPEAAGWDWIGINLADGGAVMAFGCATDRARHSGAAAHCAAPAAQRARCRATKVRFVPLRSWRSPRTGVTYPVEMRVTAGERELTLEPLFDDQELDSRASTGTIYWEGAVRATEAGREAGRGYLELTGYGAGCASDAFPVAWSLRLSHARNRRVRCIAQRPPAFALTTNPELQSIVDVSRAMKTRNLKVTTDNLRIGMFVAELDLPWLGMPFPLQGVLIDDPRQVEYLRDRCQEVMIDIHLSKAESIRHLPILVLERDDAGQSLRAAVVRHVRTWWRVSTRRCSGAREGSRSRGATLRHSAEVKLVTTTTRSPSTRLSRRRARSIARSRLRCRR
jgi:hypothetical protein